MSPEPVLLARLPRKLPQGPLPVDIAIALGGGQRKDLPPGDRIGRGLGGFLRKSDLHWRTGDRRDCGRSRERDPRRPGRQGRRSGQVGSRFGDGRRDRRRWMLMRNQTGPGLHQSRKPSGHQIQVRGRGCGREPEQKCGGGQHPAEASSPTIGRAVRVHRGGNSRQRARRKLGRRRQIPERLGGDALDQVGLISPFRKPRWVVVEQPHDLFPPA